MIHVTHNIIIYFLILILFCVYLKMYFIPPLDNVSLLSSWVERLRCKKSSKDTSRLPV